jgi:hypothetical protein
MSAGALRLPIPLPPYPLIVSSQSVGDGSIHFFDARWSLVRALKHPTQPLKRLSACPENQFSAGFKDKIDPIA